MQNIHIYPSVSLDLGFADIILKLATTGPGSSVSSSSSNNGSSRSSGTEQEQNKSRHGKWCNSIHLPVNPSGGAGPTPRRGRQEARVARRARLSPAASAAWRPPARRRGPADPSVASASLLPGALLRPSLSPPLKSYSFQQLPAPQSSSSPRLLQPAKQPFLFSPSSPLYLTPSLSSSYPEDKVLQLR